MYKKIWDKIISQNEKVEYEFSVGKLYRWFFFFVYSIIGTTLITPVYFLGPKLFFASWVLIIFIFWFHFIFYLKVANAYAFTDRRVVIHRGWLSTHTISVDYEDITDVSVIEPFISRIVTSSGHLIIDTAGTNVKEITLKNIESPYQAKKKLEEIRWRLTSHNQ